MPTITAGAFLLTADDSHRIAETGILRPGDRLELIDDLALPPHGHDDSRGRRTSLNPFPFAPPLSPHALFHGPRPR